MSCFAFYFFHREHSVPREAARDPGAQVDHSAGRARLPGAARGGHAGRAPRGAAKTELERRLDVQTAEGVVLRALRADSGARPLGEHWARLHDILIGCVLSPRTDCTRIGIPVVYSRLHTLMFRLDVETT